MDCRRDEQVVPRFRVVKELEGEGLHQWLHTTIEFEGELECEKVAVIDQLDIYTYVDKDELDRLDGKVRG